ncbi:MAG: CRTAC1 family protein [Planctomycetota bacterium]
MLDPERTGLDIVMTCGATPSTQILEVDGGGLGLIDYDGDGDLDVFVANGATMDDPEHGPGSRLYENQGGLRFRDVTAEVGISLRRWAMGVAVGDYDGDGWEDIYVTCYGPNVLLRNEGGRFADVTDLAGVGDPRWATSSAFGDLDGDGDLDLYVVNYLRFDIADPPRLSRFKGVQVMGGPHGLPTQHDVLYENLGDGTFRDVTSAAGCLPARAGYGLGVVILDFDGDGRQDIFVGNDSMANLFFRNLGEMQFEEVGGISGLAANADGGEQATMGIAVADVDGNGYADLFTTNFSSDTNTLQLNLDGRFFDDRTMQYGLGMISRPFLGWSCGFFDFDLDGDEDLLIVNGHVYPQATMESMDSPYRQPPLLFERVGARFARVADRRAGAFLAEAGHGRAAAFGDLDGDGDVDVVTGDLNGPIRVLRNDCPDGTWLIVELRDPAAPLGAGGGGLGGRVEVVCQGVTQRRWLYSGGYQSSSAAQAGFGLPAGAAAASVRITWPDGREQRLADVAVNQRLVVGRD